MDIVRNATGHDPSASPDASVEAELASLVDVYGLAILHVPEQIKLRLAQACPGAQRQIDAVLSALAADVPQRLRKANDDDKLHGLLQQLVERVEDHGSLDAATASWAVRAWAHALALPTASLAKATRAQEPSMAREFAAVVTPLGRKTPSAAGVIPKVPSTPPIDAPIAPHASSTVDEQTRPSLPDRSIDTRAVRLKVKTIDPIVEPAAVEHATIEPALVEPAVAEPVGVAPSIVMPATAPAWTAYSAAAANAAATDSLAGAVEPDTPLPPQPSRTSRAPTGRRTRVIGAALVVIVLAIFFGVDGAHWLSTRTTEMQSPTPRDSSIADATRETQSAPAIPGPAPSSSNASTPAPSTVEGRQAVPVEAAPASTTLPASTALPAALPPAPASPLANGPASAPAAGPSVPEAPPASTPADVAPREPVTAATSDAQRPTITRVDVPRVIVGAPFTVAIRVAARGHDIAAVERRVVDGRAVSPRALSVTPSTGLRRSRNGALLIPFNAVEAPSHAIIEFTAVDHNGLRSAPRRVTLTVAAAPAIATTNCTRSTCGAVVAIREHDAGPVGRSADRGARTYEVIIRMDDRTIHKAVVSEYWSTGSWVQMVGGRFVPMRSGPR